MKQSFTVPSLDRLKALAELLARHLRLGMVVTLSGPLGVGKTTFVQFLAATLGVKQRVISPTFTIMKTYPLLKGRFLHVDAYRLEGAGSFGLEDEVGEDTITMIEWPEKLSIIPFGKRIDITLSFLDETKRLLVLESDEKVSITL
jgi:tRNA threonylcarbamoyladenosine biosynthesis protein TsaE